MGKTASPKVRRSDVRDQGTETLYSTSSSATGVGEILTITPIEKPPAELLAVEQWISWNYECDESKPTEPRKPPVAITADDRLCRISPTDPDNHLSWQAARKQTAHYMLAGIGFVFTPGDPYFGVDLDGCRTLDTGRVEGWALQILAAFRGRCYVEVSPSGTGLKIWGQGKKPPGPNKWYPFPGDTTRAIEVYDRQRYFTWTGQMLKGFKKIGPAQDALDALCASAPVKAKAAGSRTSNAVRVGKPRNTTVSDQEILRRIKRANPKRYKKLFRTGAMENDDKSKLDFELACLCAKFVGDDHARIRRLMYESALVREEKWEREGDTYLSPTITKAIQWAATRSDEDAVGEESLHALNQEYAVVQVGRHALILQDKPAEQDYALLDISAFRLLLANRPPVQITDNNGDTKKVALATAWLQWEHRRQFTRIVFKPGEQVSSNEFNIWRGWGVAPSSEGSCTRFLTHLREIVCDGDLEHYNWLLDWMADIVQHPQRKLGYAVALQGLMGTGKSLIGVALKRILGRHRVVVDKPRQVTGNFNAHLEACLLLQAEEAFWAGDKTAEGTLKNIVTGDELPIERKGIDTVNRPNYTRLLITSNDDWIWPTDLGDRRLVIFKVNNRYAEPPSSDSPQATRRLMYFARLYEELQHSTFAPHLLHLLLTRPLDDMRLRRAPRTKALEEQAIHSMSPQEVWLRDLLIRGELPHGCVVDTAGRAHIRVRRLYDSYAESVSNRQNRMSEEAFRLFWKKHLPKTKDDVAWQGESREIFSHREGRHGGLVQARAHVILAPLAACRERYSRRGRAAPTTWPTPNRWEVAR